ncbi:Cadmium resistance protein CadD, predicted permease [Pseudonocardia ammonioxydans]|uniref:Cadmium resistance protein CadD, predicted permease n=1 Tax=Pseudonocardia ammonioxydans TaxID=260086 RepID=A0A1I5H7S8_PSUAM|nr:cadmium resistance transporter [Pseudonocardia ammonioxydans]SFO44253.1 Cadmium resistance protein CadD, predicted permease [Pseudonocardia ammonioxydans]
MDLTTIAQAIGLFVVTNIDDIVVVALFFAQGAGHRGATARVVAGQYLGFAAILVAALAATFGATFLPEAARAYFGLLPLLLGLRAAWKLWGGDDDDDAPASKDGPALLTVATITFANGGDNIGVYVPVFVTVGYTSLLVYAAVFLVLVGVLCAAGKFLATRAPIARALSRWGHILLPLILIALGIVILVEGGAFGL